MRSVFASLAVMMLLDSTQAVQLKQEGIFDKFFQQEAEAQALVEQKQESIAYKKKQLAEAEKQHEIDVKEEEAADKLKEEEDAKKFEERELLKRNEEAEQRRRDALAEIDAEKIQLRHQVMLA